MDKVTFGLFDRAAEGRLQATLDGELVLANRAAGRLLGYPSGDELVDAVCDVRKLLCLPPDYDAFLCRLRESGAVADFQCQVVDAQRRQRWISLSAWALHGLEGELVGFEAVFTDVTARRLVESTARAVSSSLEPGDAMRAFAHALGAVLPFDQLSLTVVEGNSYRRIFSFGVYPEEFRADEVLPLEGNPTEPVVATGQPLIVEDSSEGRWAFDRRLADVGIGSYVIVPLLRNERVFATINLGFAERGAANEAIVDLLRSVADAIAQGVQNALLFEDQRTAVEQLRRVDAARSEFIGTVSHDLRSPMAAIAGFASILHERWDSLPEPIRRRQVEHIYRTSRRVSDFVNEVLQVAHLESGEFAYDVAPFDYALLVDEAIESMGDLAERVLVDMQDDLPTALGDRHRCWQVITNLVSNALKFSPEGEFVEVHVSSSGRFITVAVSDRGRGIPPDQAERVFEKFSQARKGEGGGAGLGLYICKRMVETQGGRIWVEPRPGGGTTFFFTVPLGVGDER
jgi:signal transduction histidine kinase